MNLYLDLFFTFAKVGVCTFGGGYAMLPILQREVVDGKGWATEEELADYYAIGQCTPGIIAVNTATFVGYKYRGIAGGIVATLGVVFPSVVIITLIAAFLTSFAHIPVVQHALAGINAAVVALIAVSVLKLGRTTLRSAFSVGVFLAVLALEGVAAALGRLAPGLSGLPAQLLSVFTSPAVLVILAGFAGYLAGRLRALKRQGGEGK